VEKVRGAVRGGREPGLEGLSTIHEDEWVYPRAILQAVCDTRYLAAGGYPLWRDVDSAEGGQRPSN
jgi:hypothetical protein